MRTEDEVWNAMLASSRMPWAGGPPVEFEGRRYLDGGMASPVPVYEAVAAGATHVLALQTRPFGIPRKSASKVGDWFIERHLRGLNPQLVTLYRERRRQLRPARRGHRAAHRRDGVRAAVRARPAAGGRHADRRASSSATRRC